MPRKLKSGRQRTDFGKYILGLRQEAGLGPTEAYKMLKLKGRDRLDDLETGRKSPTYPILLRLAQIYHVSLDEMLRKAYWPQLILLPIDFLIDLEQLDRLSSDDFVKQIEKGLNDSEREELTKFVENLLYKRRVPNQCR